MASRRLNRDAHAAVVNRDARNSCSIQSSPCWPDSGRGPLLDHGNQEFLQNLRGGAKVLGFNPGERALPFALIFACPDRRIDQDIGVK